MSSVAALGVADGLQVGVDVGAAEAIDRLLGVADGDQPLVGEGRVEDVPLQPVGVLELVDEHQRVARRQLLGESRSAHRFGQRPGQVADEPVVADLAAGPLAHQHLGGGLGDESGPAPAEPGGADRGGVDRAGVGEHRLHRLDEVALDGRRLVGAAARRQVGRPALLVGRQRQRRVGQLAHEQVADHLGHHGRGALDQLDAVVGAAAQPGLDQGQLAEPVDGGDGGLVEAGDGPTQARRRRRRTRADRCRTPPSRRRRRADRRWGGRRGTRRPDGAWPGCGRAARSPRPG